MYSICCNFVLNGLYIKLQVSHRMVGHFSDIGIIARTLRYNLQGDIICTNIIVIMLYNNKHRLCRKPKHELAANITLLLLTVCVNMLIGKEYQIALKFDIDQQRSTSDTAECSKEEPNYFGHSNTGQITH